MATSDSMVGGLQNLACDGAVQRCTAHIQPVLLLAHCSTQCELSHTRCDMHTCVLLVHHMQQTALSILEDMRIDEMNTKAH